MKNILVIGGGFAGLSAAAYLSKSGYKVKLFEASPKLGGRAYSFSDEATGDIIDNGQHIMMGCYHETLNFLRMTNSLNNVSIQKNLRVVYAHSSKGLMSLSASSGIYPINLLIGFLKFKALSLVERISIVKLFLRLKFNSNNDFNKISVKQWLEREGQSQNAIRSFWEILTVGALNTSSEKASALMFTSILNQIFLKDSHSASIIIPATGLSEMYCTGAAEYIRSTGGDICLSSGVERINIENDNVTAVIVNDREYKDFDYIISAVPFFAVNKMFSSDLVPIEHFTPSSILSVHIWLKNNPFTEEFYGLIDSEVHWIFNHKNYITIVISNADKFMLMIREDICKMIVQEIKRYFSFFSDEMIMSYKIIKEKRATFIPDDNISQHRPHTITRINNLFLAGDWVKTGLPATIESAVKSGRLAAETLTLASNK